MPKMISDPEAKDPFKGYKPEKLGSGIRVDGKPLKDEPPAKKTDKKEYESTTGDRLKKIAEDTAAARESDAADRASRTNAMGDTYKKGGKVSSASARADGCACKGKTKGKMY